MEFCTVLEQKHKFIAIFNLCVKIHVTLNVCPNNAEAVKWNVECNKAILLTMKLEISQTAEPRKRYNSLCCSRKGELTNLYAMPVGSQVSVSKYFLSSRKELNPHYVMRGVLGKEDEIV